MNFYVMLERAWGFLKEFYDQAYNFFMNENEILGYTFSGFEILGTVSLLVVIGIAIIRVFLG